MSIAVSCSSCDREIKVKDDLAGRKIKCPDCGESITVREKSAKKSAQQPPRDEALMFVDRPDQGLFLCEDKFADGHLLAVVGSQDPR